MFKGRLLLIVVAFVAVMLISANAQAVGVSIPTSLGNGADTYLTNSANSGPNVPHGTETTLNRLFLLSGARVAIGYVRFDLTDIEPGPGHTWADIFDGATLSVESISNGSNRAQRWTGVYGLTLTATGGVADWPEATTTYGGGVYDSPAEGTVMTKAPGMVWVDATHPAPGFYELNPGNDQLVRLGEILLNKTGASGTAIIITSSPTEQSVVQTGTGFAVAGSLNLAPFLSSMVTELGTNRYVTLAIICEVAKSNADYYITSQEGVGVSTGIGGYIGTMAPTLNLPNVPEPATIALLGLGGLSLLRIRRKR
jgi:hypothetical protein